MPNEYNYYKNMFELLFIKQFLENKEYANSDMRKEVRDFDLNQRQKEIEATHLI